MGYDTDFAGQIDIDPPLNADEIQYLKQFYKTRHMLRQQGEYYVDGAWGHDYTGVDQTKGHHNIPPASQPGLWCKFIPNETGTALVWSEDEKTYDAVEWVRYLIDHFLKPNALASKSPDPQFKNFTFNHQCNGTLLAQGERITDRWKIQVKDNIVRKIQLGSKTK